MRVFHNRVLRLVAVAILLGTALAGTSEASTVTLTPSTQSVALGGFATVDVILSGLTASETVGGFYINLAFNPGILTGYSYLNDPDLKMGLATSDFSFGFLAGGNLDLFFTADPNDLVYTQAVLKGLQGTGFRLATLTFQGTGAGLSPVTISAMDLSNFAGNALLAAPSVSNADICVGSQPCTTAVPEASSVALMFVGLACFAALAVRQHRLLTQV